MINKNTFYKIKNTAVLFLASIILIAPAYGVLATQDDEIESNYDSTDSNTETIEVEDIEFDDYNSKIAVDETESLVATVLPSNATDSTVSYKSSDENILTVSSKGIVKGIHKGEATVTASSGNVQKNLSFKVIVSTTEIVVESKYVVLNIGEKFAINAHVKPDDADSIINYKSTNQSVVSVSDSGIITAEKEGRASIIVSNSDYIVPITVIVNNQLESNEIINKDKQEKTLKEEKPLANISYDISDCPEVDTNLLKELYKSNGKLTIIANSYTIIILGENIKNTENKLLTNIQLKNIDDGVEFLINGGDELCGMITLLFEKQHGSYLYLFNEVNQQYESIKIDNPKKIDITSSGRYRLVNHKIRTKMSSIKILLASIVIIIFLLIIYILLNKKYWFW